MTEVERVCIGPSSDSLDLIGFQGFWPLVSAQHWLRQTLYELQPNPQSFDWLHFASCSFHIASHPWPWGRGMRCPEHQGPRIPSWAENPLMCNPRRLGTTAARGASLTNWIWWLADKFLPPKSHRWIVWRCNYLHSPSGDTPARLSHRSCCIPRSGLLTCSRCGSSCVSLPHSAFLRPVSLTLYSLIK